MANMKIQKKSICEHLNFWKATIKMILKAMNSLAWNVNFLLEIVNCTKDNLTMQLLIMMKC